MDRASGLALVHRTWLVKGMGAGALSRAVFTGRLLVAFAAVGSLFRAAEAVSKASYLPFDIELLDVPDRAA